MTPVIHDRFDDDTLMHAVEDSDVPVAAGDYHVHVYTVIRTKVAVTAADHRSAMEAADRLLFDHEVPVALVPRSSHVAGVEHAGEVVEYLVDEVDDDDHQRTRSYGPDHHPDPVHTDRPGVCDPTATPSPA